MLGVYMMADKTMYYFYTISSVTHREADHTNACNYPICPLVLESYSHEIRHIKREGDKQAVFRSATEQSVTEPVVLGVNMLCELTHFLLSCCAHV